MLIFKIPGQVLNHTLAGLCFAVKLVISLSYLLQPSIKNALPSSPYAGPTRQIHSKHTDGTSPGTKGSQKQDFLAHLTINTVNLTVVCDTNTKG